MHARVRSRLGQTKEVHIKQYAYRDSLDEAILALHAAVATGDMALRDGTYPPEAVELFRKHGVATPHVGDGTTSNTRTHKNDDLHGYKYEERQWCACPSLFRLRPAAAASVRDGGLWRVVCGAVTQRALRHPLHRTGHDYVVRPRCVPVP